MGNNNIAIKLINMIIDLTEKPMTTVEIMKRYELSDRTVYRYIGYIEEIGFDLDKAGKKWFICDNTPFYNSARKFLKLAKKQKDKHKRTILTYEFTDLKNSL